MTTSAADGSRTVYCEKKQRDIFMTFREMETKSLQRIGGAATAAGALAFTWFGSYAFSTVAIGWMFLPCVVTATVFAAACITFFTMSDG